MNFNFGLPPMATQTNDFSNMANWGGANYGTASIATPEVPVFDLSTTAAPGALANMSGSGGGLMDWFNKTPLATTTGPNGMKTQGMFDMGLGAAQGLLGAYLGFQNLGIAKDTLSQNKRQFDLNFGAQQKLTNARLADRQAARLASNPTAYQSQADYMAKNGI